MPRPPRLQLPGYCYHIYNRGNYRQPIFDLPGATKVFREAFFDTAREFGWRVQAFALLGNHYHLAIELQDPNLSDGVQWLQSRVSNTVNRYHAQRGHLFQGRFRSLVVQSDAYLVRLVNYIHLNPVRAGILTTSQLRFSQRTSLALFAGDERLRMECLDCHWLKWLGLEDDHAGWAAYLEVLRRQVEGDGGPRAEPEEDFLRGWAIGSPEWQAAVGRCQAAAGQPDTSSAKR